jgi:hypothetical protein
MRGIGAEWFKVLVLATSLFGGVKFFEIARDEPQTIK